MATLIPRNRLEPAGEAFRARAPQPCLISKPHGRGGFQRGAGLSGGRLDPITDPATVSVRTRRFHEDGTMLPNGFPKTILGKRVCKKSLWHRSILAR